MAENDEIASTAGAIADAEEAMRKGRRGPLIGMIVVGVVVLVGVVFLLGSGDEARVYGEMGKTINGLKQAKFDGFWACALPGTNLKNVRSNSDLVSQINVRASEKGRAFGAHVRDKCVQTLDGVAPHLDTLIVPDDLKADVAAMRKAVDDLRSAWSSFVRYLDNPELVYAFEDAEPRIVEITRAWFEFKKAHAAFNKTLKAKLK
jgi:hypothetical protein